MLWPRPRGDRPPSGTRLVLSGPGMTVQHTGALSLESTASPVQCMKGAQVCGSRPSPSAPGSLSISKTRKLEGMGA